MIADESNKSHHHIEQWLEARGALKCHRQLVIISGRKSFCEQKRAVFTDYFVNSHIHALGTAMTVLPGSFPLKQATQLLGKTCLLGVYDAFDGFRPSALLALAGTIAQNGLLVICTPSLDIWHQYHEETTNHYLSFGQTIQCSPFRQYFADQFNANCDIALIEENGQCRLPSPRPAPIKPTAPDPFASLDQKTVFDALAVPEETGFSLLTADRGRGKSTLLGILAAHWLLAGKSVRICSRFPDSVTAIFDGIGRYSSRLTITQDKKVNHKQHSIAWLPVDHPDLVNDTKAILIIDEAANLPIPTLKILCSLHSRVILSSTLRGYEGTGRGFITRFIPWLRRQNTDTDILTLSSPCRWAEDDPVELFLNQALQLDSPTVDESTFNENPNNKDNGDTLTDIDVTFLTNKTPETFRDALALLMTAHYQTSVDELVRLCDAPDTHTIIATLHGKVIGVLNVQLEGGELLSPLGNEIASGKRRVNGHMSAQAMSLFLADPAVANYRYCRINRIAIDYSYRRNGFATHLLNTLKHWLSDKAIDAVTTSFGTTATLVNFWLNCGFYPVKAGLKQDASSGEYSLLMWRPVSTRAIAKKPLVNARFAQEIGLHPDTSTFGKLHAWNMQEPENNIDNNAALFDCNMTILQQVATGQRQIQHARGSVAWLIAYVNKTNIKMPENSSKALTSLTDFIAHCDSLTDFIQQYGLTGRKQAYAFASSQLAHVLNSNKLYAES